MRLIANKIPKKLEMQVKKEKEEIFKRLQI